MIVTGPSENSTCPSHQCGHWRRTGDSNLYDTRCLRCGLHMQARVERFAGSDNITQGVRVQISVPSTGEEFPWQTHETLPLQIENVLTN